MKTYPLIISILVAFESRNAISQGFINLGFEAADVSGRTQGSISSVATSAAFPGWTAFFISPSGTNIQGTVLYNALPLGTPTISIGDTNLAQYNLGPIGGRYSALLFGVTDTSAALSQSGLIPVGTVSILLDVRSVTSVEGKSFTVLINNQAVALSVVQQFSGYALYGGDISAYAGQSSLLTIMTPPATLAGYPNGWQFDNIQFSTNPVPEPSVLALLAIGVVGLLGYHRMSKPLQQ